MKTKFKFIKNLQEVLDLLMIQEGDEEHVREPKVRIIWHILACIGFILFFFQVLSSMVFRDYLVSSPLSTYYHRIIYIALIVIIIFLLTLLGYRHYKFMILSGKDLRFKIIAFFFTSGFILYGMLYNKLYVLNPDLFTYLHPAHIPNDVTTVLPLVDSWKFSNDFIFYSLCISLNKEYHLITSNSQIVTMINSLQIISNALLIALLIASFVQKKTDNQN